MEYTCKKYQATETLAAISLSEFHTVFDYIGFPIGNMENPFVGYG